MQLQISFSIWQEDQLVTTTYLSIHHLRHQNHAWTCRTDSLWRNHSDTLEKIHLQQTPQDVHCHGLLNSSCSNEQCAQLHAVTDTCKLSEPQMPIQHRKRPQAPQMSPPGATDLMDTISEHRPEPSPWMGGVVQVEVLPPHGGSCIAAQGCTGRLQSQRNANDKIALQSGRACRHMRCRLARLCRKGISLAFMPTSKLDWHHKLQQLWAIACIQKNPERSQYSQAPERS